MKVSKSFFPVFLGSFLLTTAVFAAGGSDRGGGDANSARIRKIAHLFDGDHAGITQDLIAFATNLAKLKPTGVIAAQIDDLVAKGIIEDFKAATYDLEPVCTDEHNIERSASTLKVDLSANPQQPRPTICVNVRKLAEEDASYESLIGLLFHEHARHFGLEDTDHLSLNPIADFVTEKLGYILTGDVGELLTDGVPNHAGLVCSRIGRNGNDIWNTRYECATSQSTTQGIQASLVIDAVSGNCNGAKVFFAHQIVEGIMSNGPVFLREELGKASPGTAFKLPESSSAIHIVGFQLGIPSKRSVVAKIFSGHVFGDDLGCHEKPSCEVTSHLEVGGRSYPSQKELLRSDTCDDGYTHPEPVMEITPVDIRDL